MQDWYQTREAGNLNHRGQAIAQGKKILLTEAQARLHNKNQEKVAKCDSPKDPKEVGVLAEWEEWETSVKTKGKTSEEVKSQKSKVKSNS